MTVSKFRSVLPLSILNLVLLLLLSKAEAKPQVECLDFYSELRPNGWNPMAPPGYADTENDLPGPLKGQPGLEGDGIFYFSGGTGSIYKDFEHAKDNLPIFLYVKYYGHQQTHNTTEYKGVMVAYPPITEQLEPGQFYHTLKPTANFTWSEELIQISGDSLTQYAIAAGIRDFARGEYFLVEKMIVSQGIAIESVEQIKSLCTDGIPTESTETASTEESGQSTTDSNYQVQCLDFYSELENNGWNPMAPPYYADTTNDLPEPLKGQPGLEGDGIFYFAGDTGSIYKDYTRAEVTLPIFLYVKYYGHQRTNNTPDYKGVMVAYPPITEQLEPGQFYHKLKPTSNFTWSEELVQISGDSLKRYALAAGVRDFVEGEYFLVEKMIVTQGIAIKSVEHIKSLCSDGWTASTSTTEGSGDRISLQLHSIIFFAVVALAANFIF